MYFLAFFILLREMAAAKGGLNTNHFHGLAGGHTRKADRTKGSFLYRYRRRIRRFLYSLLEIKFIRYNYTAKYWLND